MTASDLIGSAVNQNRPASKEGILERAFGRLFRGLVYPQIWEDPVCDMEALELTDTDHIVCIASGGCNMMSYLSASPASITAVDLSPWHMQLGRLKLAAVQTLDTHEQFYALFGHADRADNVALIDQITAKMEPDARAFWNGRSGLYRRKSLFAHGFYRFGALGRFIGFVHLLNRFQGVRFERLLTAPTLQAQRDFFETEIAPVFDTKLVRFLAKRRASLFGLGIPPAQYDKLAEDGGGNVLPVLKERARKLFCDFPIGENYFAWQAAFRAYKPDGRGPVPPYLTPDHFDTIRAAAPSASVVNESITDMLRHAPAASKSVFILLDAQDWMSDVQLTDLWTEITRTATPDARVLFRTGGAANILPGRVPASLLSQWHYDRRTSERAFKTDRSAIYGGVHLYRKARAT